MKRLKKLKKLYTGKKKEEADVEMQEIHSRNEHTDSDHSDSNISEPDHAGTSTKVQSKKGSAAASSSDDFIDGDLYVSNDWHAAFISYEQVF